jgi:ABC-type phosphate transport system permease subunit
MYNFVGRIATWNTRVHGMEPNFVDGMLTVRIISIGAELGLREAVWLSNSKNDPRFTKVVRP